MSNLNFVIKIKLTALLSCKILLWIILAFTNLYNTTSQELDLKQCIEFAIQNNLSIQQANYNIENNRLKYNQSKLGFLPLVTGEYSHQLSSGRSLNQETYSWDNNNIQQGDMGINMELPVMQGLFNVFNLKVNQYSYESSKQELLKQIQVVSVEVVKLYYEIVLVSNSININELSLINTNKEIERLNERIIAGVSSKSDMYELKAQAIKEQLSIDNLKISLELKYMDLKKLLNWPDDKYFQINLNIDYLQHNLLDTTFSNIFLNELVTRRPEVQKKYLDIKSSQNLAKMYRSYQYPTITMNAFLSTRYLIDALDPTNLDKGYNYIDQVENNLNKQISVTLSIPIFNKYDTRLKIRMAEIRIQELTTEKQIIEQNLLNELLKIARQITYLQEKMKLTEQMAYTYKKSYDTALEKFRSGLLNSYELNIAKNNYLISYMKHLKQQVEYSMNIEIIDIYSESGHWLWFQPANPK